MAVSAIHQEKRVRFYNAVDLVNLLEKEKQLGKSGSLAKRLIQIDAVILDELGYLPFPESGGALLFHHQSTVRKDFSDHYYKSRLAEWVQVFGDEK
ncbi:ATP-binding protein [Nitrosomonas sp.]|uniref:ATP-binding protein n=1 Tax=Nitrosomonas sp. TaxID=42353 RepID=UPI003A5C3A86